MTQEN